MACEKIATQPLRARPSPRRAGPVNEEPGQQKVAGAGRATGKGKPQRPALPSCRTGGSRASGAQLFIFPRPRIVPRRRAACLLQSIRGALIRPAHRGKPQTRSEHRNRFRYVEPFLDC
jgi:hypothetical protein